MLPIGERGYVCIHPGARLASRRWPLERFARVADALAGFGFTIVLTGSAGEAGLVDAVRSHMRRSSINLCGRTNLGTLAALVQQASLLVCNDTGISHVAAAVGTPSVVVCCGADPARWRPLDHARHKVLWSDVPCRPCAYEHCPTGHECAIGVSAQSVVARAVKLLAATEEADIVPAQL
jgi:ADP-heptose:LPS heptosyltransferase